jgi:hypothetical protein
MSTQKIPLPGLVYNGSLPIILTPGASATLGTASEWAISTVPVASGAGTLTAAANIATLTFAAAHGVVKSIINGQNYFTATGQNVATPYFQLSGVTGVTAFNAVTWTILDVPSTTTITFFTTLSATGAVFTAGSFAPLYTLLPGDYDFLLGANGVIQYNPDGTGIPQGPFINPSVTGATYRQLAAVSTAGQLWFDGVGQKFFLANGGAGTSRFSQIS